MLNVYIADDEVWITLGLKKLLERIDVDSFVVGTANNGLMAKEEIAMFKPDVIFTDIRMPGLSGL
ncbi:MAG: response regulator, partial [Lachnospiraceae bacterium]|nr:response regulator [Lachnospiraceae bacterium]